MSNFNGAVTLGDVLGSHPILKTCLDEMVEDMREQQRSDQNAVDSQTTISNLKDRIK